MHEWEDELLDDKEKYVILEDVPFEGLSDEMCIDKFMSGKYGVYFIQI